MTADEAKAKSIQAMGEELGSLYDALWQQLAWLYRKWAEYVVLFGTKESRVILLNRAAPAFTRIVQDTLWEDVILHVARLTDPLRSGGKKDNLTVRALESLTPDVPLKSELSKLVAEALSASEFCRDWRNRHIAHRDIGLALQRGAEPLMPASRLKVRQALDGLAKVLNAVSMHYHGSTTMFEIDLHSDGGPGGARSLLYFLDLGIHAEESRRERLRSGYFDHNEYRPNDL
jgi:hypothetical protein